MKSNIYTSRIQYLPKLFGILTFILFLSSCKKLAEVPAPSFSIVEQNVYQTDPTAISVLTGIYGNMSSPYTYTITGNQGVSLLLGLSADELTLYNGITTGNLVSYYTNTLGIASPTYGTEFWSPLYNYIYTCNAALLGVGASSALTPRVKQQLLGEARFMRAFFYFYLVNLYGYLPMPLTTDYNVNGTLGRSPQALVYQQMIADLKDAQGLLSTDYLDGGLN